MAAKGIAFGRGEGSMSKMAASEVAVRATERAIQTLGGWGYIKDHPVEKWYRDAKLYTIFEGTSEIQRIVISHALGATEGAPPLHVELEPSGGTAEPGIRPRHAAAGSRGRRGTFRERPGPRATDAGRHASAAAPAQVSGIKKQT